MLLAHFCIANGTLILKRDYGGMDPQFYVDDVPRLIKPKPSAVPVQTLAKDVDSQNKFVPVAMSRSPTEFFHISWDHVVYIADKVTRRKTLFERYKEGPANRVQDIGSPVVWHQVLRRAAVTHAIILALVLLIMHFNPRDLPLDPPKDTDRDPEAEWAVGPFNAMEDMQVTKWALFCPGTRWAQTAEQTGFLSFWVAFWIINVLWFVKWIYFWICTWFMLFDITGLVLIVHRRRMRRLLGLPTGILTWGEDCCLSFFCAFNIIAHEARVAKAVLRKTQTPKDG